MREQILGEFQLRKLCEGEGWHLNKIDEIIMESGEHFYRGSVELPSGRVIWFHAFKDQLASNVEEGFESIKKVVEQGE